MWCNSLSRFTAPALPGHTAGAGMSSCHDTSLCVLLVARLLASTGRSFVAEQAQSGIEKGSGQIADCRPATVMYLQLACASPLCAHVLVSVRLRPLHCLSRWHAAARKLVACCFKPRRLGTVRHDAIWARLGTLALAAAENSSLRRRSKIGIFCHLVGL